MQLLKSTEDNISRTAQMVRNGGLVVYPTDTVYGLGCDPFNTGAVRRLLMTKSERRNKPLPILASGLKAIEKIARIDMKAKKISEKYWPGPLTLIVLKKKVLPDVVTCGLGSVGVRVPNHEVALKLIELCDGLIVGTSANKSGRKSPTTAEEAHEQLGIAVDLILDGGRAQLGRESSIIDLTSTTPRMIREGPVKFRQIKETLRLAKQCEKAKKHGNA